MNARYLHRNARAAAGLTAIACLACADAALAQSNVTIYGTVDGSLRRATHYGPANQTYHSEGDAVFSPSRFGLRGSEDIGGGVKAGFVLENGFLTDTGKLDQQGQLFGRQAYVKIGNQWGELAMGRQYTTANTMLYYVDPLGVGAAPSNSWMVYLTGQRYDNAVSYTGNFGPVSVIAEYALGETAGKGSASSSVSLGLRYASGPITAIGDFQQTRDIQSRAARIYMAGLKASVGRGNLFANYIYSDRDGGFDSSRGGTDTATITSMSTAPTPTNRAAINSVFNGSRRDDFFTVGASYPVTGSVTLTGSVMHNRTRADNFSGNRTTAYGVADYAFSKRTDAYLAVAYDWVHGDWSGLFGNNTTSWTGDSGRRLDGRDNQTTVMVGLRHQF